MTSAATCTCPCHRGAGHHHRGAGLGADPCRCGVVDPAAYQPTYCDRCGFQTVQRRSLCLMCTHGDDYYRIVGGRADT